jgi:heme-degrading monooxygenase HmoA
MPVFVTSGQFIVKPGEEEQFVAVWTAVRTALQELNPPLRGVVKRGRMLRDLRTPRRYVSIAEFDSPEAIEEFQSRPDVAPLIGAMREHLEEVNISMFEQVISP